ncbi:MAG: hypothetical protein HYX78_03235 [Armatimonadetes bacterium]|nr:hypothetical protein [Armatimonadota bacterium]
MSKAQKKAERVRRAMSHHEPDRVPVSEFFWTNFLKRCREKWGQDFDPYRYWDLDFVIVAPNLDPRIQPFEIIQDDGEDIVIKTGFGATIRRSGDKPMPHWEAFEIDVPEKMAELEFDAPDDPRRFLQGGDDQINGVSDTFVRDIPSWDERVNSYADDFAVFAGICECYEMIIRIIGSENALFWMAAYPDLFADFVNRIGRHQLDVLRAQIKHGKGRLAGVFIAGDVAYRRGMLFSPAIWRELFKPHLKNMMELSHQHGFPVLFHGCGNATAIYDDLIEIGLDCYNPVEAKADLDVVELKKTYANRLAFCGNIDIRVLESNDPDKIVNEIKYKLQAAKGGGYIFFSDHSVSSEVDPESYDLAIRTLREVGNYPLNLQH